MRRRTLHHVGKDYAYISGKGALLEKLRYLSERFFDPTTGGLHKVVLETAADLAGGDVIAPHLWDLHSPIRGSKNPHVQFNDYPVLPNITIQGRIRFWATKADLTDVTSWEKIIHVSYYWRDAYRSVFWFDDAVINYGDVDALRINGFHSIWYDTSTGAFTQWSYAKIYEKYAPTTIRAEFLGSVREPTPGQLDCYTHIRDLDTGDETYGHWTKTYDTSRYKTCFAELDEISDAYLRIFHRYRDIPGVHATLSYIIAFNRHRTEFEDRAVSYTHLTLPTN